MKGVPIQISLKYVHTCPIDNKPDKQSLVQVLACHSKSDKPLSEPMLTQFSDAYMQHYVGFSQLEYFTKFHEHNWITFSDADKNTNIDSSIWFIFSHRYRSVVCNILMN